MFEESRRDRPGVAAHAYDPVTRPELFEGVLSRRVIAFLVDLFMIAVPLACWRCSSGVRRGGTLGLGWFLFFLSHADLGDLGARLLRADASAAALAPPSALCAWSASKCAPVRRGPSISCSAPCTRRLLADRLALTPFVCWLGLFNDRKRLLHDIAGSATVVINAARAGALAAPL
jgi:hypothetical protein